MTAQLDGATHAALLFGSLTAIKHAVDLVRDLIRHETCWQPVNFDTRYLQIITEADRAAGLAPPLPPSAPTRSSSPRAPPFGPAPSTVVVPATPEMLPRKPTASCPVKSSLVARVRAACPEMEDRLGVQCRVGPKLGAPNPSSAYFCAFGVLGKALSAVRECQRLMRDLEAEAA
jgi:hypothetical protein